MKRWLLAVAALLVGGAFSFVYADYIVLIANLGQLKDKDKTAQPGPGGPGRERRLQTKNPGGHPPGFFIVRRAEP